MFISVLNKNYHGYCIITLKVIFFKLKKCTLKQINEN